MSSSSLFIIKSKTVPSFKRRISLSEDAQNISVPGKAGKYVKLSLIMRDGRPAWASNDSRFKVGFQSSPILLEKIDYPVFKVSNVNKKSAKKASISFQYFIIHKNTGRLISSKVFKKERTFNKKQFLKEFDVHFDEKIHQIKSQPIIYKYDLDLEDDKFSHNFSEVVTDKRLGVLLSVLLSFWLLSHSFDFIKDFFKTETITKIEVENRLKVSEEKKKIVELLKNEPPKKTIVKNTNDNKPLKSKGAFKRKSKKKQIYSAKKKTSKKLKSGKNTVAATKKSRVKKKSKPSLQDQLFSRDLVKGSTGRVSTKAKKTLRGSEGGKSSGKNYANTGSIKGGFVKGTGSSFGSKLDNRGGSGGGTHKTGGNGIGGLGAGLSLNGSGAGVSGGLTREQINKVVRRNKKDISRCFETREQFRPGLSGDISMNFTINSMGRVDVAKAGASTISDGALKNCLSRKISTWRFDKPTGGRLVKVSYPFNFKSTQGKF